MIAVLDRPPVLDQPQATGDRRHAVRRFDARPPACPHCDGRLTEGHYRDTGDIDVCPADACPVIWQKRNRRTVAA